MWKCSWLHNSSNGGNWSQITYTQHDCRGSAWNVLWPIWAILHIPPAQSILLLLDGQSSHYQPELLRPAAGKGIIIFCLPPHTTHLLQPLDYACFASIKIHWGEECHHLCSPNASEIVKRYNFPVFPCCLVARKQHAEHIASFGR